MVRNSRSHENLSGTGSTTWAMGSLYVGDAGAGTLNVTHGSLVTVTGTTYVAYASTATGSINFGPNGGTLTTQSLYGSPAQVTGTRTINARGLVADGTVVFDATHGATQSLPWVNTQQNVILNLDLTGASGAVGDLGAGYLGTGALAIRTGVVVTSANGYLGYNHASIGTATIEGNGSKRTVVGLYVGNSGAGTLIVTNVGKAAGPSTYGAQGVVDGAFPASI